MNIYSTLLLGLRWPILIQIERGGIGRWVALFQKWWSTLFQGRCECTGLGKKRFRVYLPNAVPQPHKVLGVLSRICLLHVFPRKQSCAFVFCTCSIFGSEMWEWYTCMRASDQTQSLSRLAQVMLPWDTVNALACCKQLTKQWCVLPYTSSWV